MFTLFTFNLPPTLQDRRAKKTIASMTNGIAAVAAADVPGPVLLPLVDVVLVAIARAAKDKKSRGCWTHGWTPYPMSLDLCWCHL